MDFNNGFSTGLDPKGGHVVLRNTASLDDEAEHVAPGEGLTVEAVIPNTNGSSDNSSRRASSRSSQRNGFGESSTDPMPLLNVDIEFIEPFWEHFARALSSFREGFVSCLNETEGPDDIDSLLNLCDILEQSTKRVDAKLVGFPSLVQLLTTFRNC
ncbi:hypothetical protein ACLOJK_023126 [Asimina triloba]